MTTKTMRRQIDKLKTELEVIKPKPPATIKILAQPDPAAGGDAMLDFLIEVRDTKRTHDHVFVVCFNPLDERRGQTIEGVRYFENDFHALGAKVFFNRKITPELALSFCGSVTDPGPKGCIPLGASKVASA
jgi:hypothetical protein